MNTTTRFKIFANLYKDSVTLMQLGAQLRGRDGIAEASCLMATPANLAQLQHADLSIDTEASPSDLLVVVRGDPAACDEAIEAADALLQAKGASGGGGAEAFSMPLEAYTRARWTCRTRSESRAAKDGVPEVLPAMRSHESALPTGANMQ